MVAAVLEEAPDVLGCYCREGLPHGLQQGPTRPSLCIPQHSLDLGESLLYGVVVRRVGRQIHKFAAPIFDELPYPIRLVGGQVVHYHNPAFLQLRSQGVLQVGFKHLGSGAPLNRQTWPHPLGAHARQQSRVLAAVARHLQAYALTLSRVAVDGCERDMSATFVHEHQSPLVEHSGDGYLPSSSQPFVSLAGTHCPFFLVNPIRLRARQRLDLLTLNPASVPRYSHLWWSLAKGRSLRSASTSLLARSSTFGRLPGALPGESELPWRNFLT